MNQRVMKLRAAGMALEVAQVLVEHGLDTPRKIKAAADKDLALLGADKDAKIVAWKAKLQRGEQ